MATRFWLAAILFHMGMALCAALIGWRWTRGAAGMKGAGWWWGALFHDAVLFGAAALALAIAAGLLVPRPLSPPFAMARFLCQALFGEAPALALWIAALHLRLGRPRRAAVPALVAALLLAVYFEAYHHGPYDLQVRRYTVDLSGGRSDARVLRIVHLSDIQTNRIGSFEERAIRLARQQAPDMIVFTGDYIEERLAPTHAAASAAFTELLRRERLRAPRGFFAVQGDHDRKDWPRLFDGLDVTCLDNRSIKVALPGGRSLVVIGLDATMSRGYDPPAILQLIDAAPPADLRMVVGHSPDFVQALAGRRKVELALAGHTHGGQVVIPFFGPPLTLSRLPRKYAGGLHDYHGIPLHVSRGIGMERRVAPQIRFLCPPEIDVLEIRYAPSAVPAIGTSFRPLR